jgi:hypothetical protein
MKPQTAPNQIAWNQAVQSQTKPCIAKLSGINKERSADVLETGPLSVFKQRST